MGFCKPEYLPTNRGFDSHFGYWNAAEDYFTKYVMRTGKDFHDGEEDIVNDDVIGSTYSTVRLCTSTPIEWSHFYIIINL